MLRALPQCLHTTRSLSYSYTATRRRLYDSVAVGFDRSAYLYSLLASNYLIVAQPLTYARRRGTISSPGGFEGIVAAGSWPGFWFWFFLGILILGHFVSI